MILNIARFAILFICWSVLRDEYSARQMEMENPCI